MLTSPPTSVTPVGGAVAEAATLTFLTLGDGDFSFSRDLACYLSTSPLSQSNRILLIATGIDSEEELTKKYKDSPNLLQKLSKNATIHVEIQHCVNAVLYSSKIPASDHVIFNHPHLGTEDAKLHSHFLCHLFHTAAKGWMNPNGGLLHLTLVEGQYDRWRCHEAAQRHGLVLLHKTNFQPPPIEQPYYQYRRHQTGKSFESRRQSGGSETFTFGRHEDSGLYPATPALPWQHDEKLAETKKEEAALIDCPYCEKTFREDRSLSCHMKDKHAQHQNKKQKRGSREEKEVTADVVLFKCALCKSEGGELRTFASADALEQHNKAAHNAMHSKIKPDWHKPQQYDDGGDSSGHNGTGTSKSSGGQQQPAGGEAASFGSCGICGLVYRVNNQSDLHEKQFIPPLGSSERYFFHCSFCSKAFRLQRDRLQHENFCALQFTAN
jgi:uncharacterized C2H2 Zn-finger protein